MTPTENTARRTISSLRPILTYLLFVFVISIIIYYVPDFSILEAWIAQHSSFILNSIGVSTKANLVGDSVFIGTIQVIRDCTGIQVIAVFAGLLLPVPKTSWRKKVTVVAAIAIFVYSTNLLRVVVQYWLMAEGVLPWSFAHYPVSLILGVICVAIIIVLTDRILPEFANFVSSQINEVEFRFRVARR